MAVDPAQTETTPAPPAEEVDYEELIQSDRVHSALYTDPEIFEDEIEKIFYRTWVFLAHESEVPEPGDYRTKRLGRQPLILTRDENGEIHVLINRCTHRGNLVCNDQKGHSNVFRCSYHGWTFNNQGNLIGVPYDDGYPEDFDKEEFHLGRVPNVDSYRGFIFVNMKQDPPGLEEHLGKATEAIDRLVDLSPEGEIEMNSGWLNHRVDCNWKMVLENEPDGYHPRFVHQSLFEVLESRMDESTTKKAGTVVRDLGNGHSEIDFAPSYRKTDEKLVWFDRADPDDFSDYIDKMEERYGEDEAHDKLVDGPPHVMIFPNLFLAEMNILTIEPLGVDRTIQHQTPVQLKGAPRVNKRVLHQFEGAMGPAGFLLGDDAEIYERTQIGVQGRDPAWVELSRGLSREERDEKGRLVGDLTDETPQRAIWQHYRSIMKQPIEETMFNGD